MPNPQVKQEALKNFQSAIKNQSAPLKKESGKTNAIKRRLQGMK